MTDRETLWDGELDSLPGEPVDGHEPRTEPIPVAEVDEGPAHDASPGQVQEEFSYARPIVDRSSGFSAGTLTFKAPPPPWWRTRSGAILLLAAVAAVAALAIAPLMFRGAPADTEDNPPPTSAVPGSDATPTPSGVTPTLTSAPAPPPPPPPPPTPPVEDSAPVITRQYPAPRSSEPDKPEIGVTRAPISVAPDIRTPPPTNSAKVGDNRGGGFW